MNWISLFEGSAAMTLTWLGCTVWALAVRRRVSGWGNLRDANTDSGSGTRNVGDSNEPGIENSLTPQLWRTVGRMVWVLLVVVVAIGIIGRPAGPIVIGALLGWLVSAGREEAAGQIQQQRRATELRRAAGSAASARRNG